ncbi:MAG TPA: ThuA domain-containing protein [Acidobacteriota bacterium]|nr:ThuA domain-containing protein [Acidobacteriota bacterium]
MKFNPLSKIMILLLLLAGCSTSTESEVSQVAEQPQQPPLLVFVTGDHEYSSERTMPLLASVMESRYGFRTEVVSAYPDEYSEENIPGLDSLESADLAIFFLRWRRLPEEQIKHIEEYLNSGRPIVGFRTTTHAFRYPESHPLEEWNEFGARFLGAPWIYHYGHESSTDVYKHSEAQGHPILDGVAGQFHVRSWLYHVLPDYPPASATVLMMGKSVGPSGRSERVDNPVAWTFQTPAGGRVFTTTMGHPEDFAVEPFQRLVVNGIHWAVGQPIPTTWEGPLDINVPYEKETANQSNR